mgnify:CR=1 FL=1
MSVAMLHTVDPRENLYKSVGDFSQFEIFNNQIIVAVYIRPEKTKGGIIMTPNTLNEDRYQSKIGLVLKKGPSAFETTVDSPWFKDVKISEGDWVVFRPSDGWEVTLNGCLCRILEDTAVRGRVDNPDRVW